MDAMPAGPGEISRWPIGKLQPQGGETPGSSLIGRSSTSRRINRIASSFCRPFILRSIDDILNQFPVIYTSPACKYQPRWQQ